MKSGKFIFGLQTLTRKYRGRGLKSNLFWQTRRKRKGKFFWLYFILDADVSFSNKVHVALPGNVITKIYMKWEKGKKNFEDYVLYLVRIIITLYLLRINFFFLNKWLYKLVVILCCKTSDLKRQITSWPQKIKKAKLFKHSESFGECQSWQLAACRVSSVELMPTIMAESHLSEIHMKFYFHLKFWRSNGKSYLAPMINDTQK